MSSDEESARQDLGPASDSEESEQEAEAAEMEEQEEVPDKFSHESELMNMVFGNKEQLIDRLRGDGPLGKQEKDDTKKRKAVWQDEDDERVNVQQGMKSSHVKRYLQDPDRQYKKHLASNFQKIVGDPKWAQLDREASDSDSDNDSALLRTVGHVIAPSTGALMRTNLDYRRKRDMNKNTSTEGPTIKAVEFHPNSTVGLVAGVSGVASLFSVAGKECDKLHSVKYDKFPIDCARFTRGGEEVIFGSQEHNYIQSFDLLSGKSRKTMLPRTEMTNAKKFELTPDGQMMVIHGRFGEIHLLHTKTKEWITTLKQEHTVAAVAVSPDSNQLFVHSQDNLVNIFDLRRNRVMHRFVDDGCIKGRTVSISPNNQMVATGSAEGIVNIYNTEDVLREKCPQPIKVISNLTTAITAARFNHTSEILGICSRATKDGLKLVHFPSGTVFANFPINTRKVGYPTCLAFSPGGRYMGVGTVAFKVPLYELKHYNYF